MRPSGFRIRDSGHAHLGAIRDCRFQISERQEPARLRCVGQTTPPPGGDSRLQIPDLREARARKTLVHRGRRYAPPAVFWLLTPESCLAGPFLDCGSQNEPAHFSLAIRFSFAYNTNHGCPRDQWSWGELFLKWCEHGFDASAETGL